MSDLGLQQGTGFAMGTYCTVTSDSGRGTFYKWSVSTTVPGAQQLFNYINDQNTLAIFVLRATILCSSSVRLEQGGSAIVAWPQNGANAPCLVPTNPTATCKNSL